MLNLFINLWIASALALFVFSWYRPMYAYALASVNAIVAIPLAVHFIG